MTPTLFNQRLLEAKQRALDTLEELCDPAFVRPRIPTTNPDGSSLTYDQRNRAQASLPRQLDPTEKRIALHERATRIRAAHAILRTKPLSEDGADKPPHTPTRKPTPLPGGEGQGVGFIMPPITPQPLSTSQPSEHKHFSDSHSQPSEQAREDLAPEAAGLNPTNTNAPTDPKAPTAQAQVTTPSTEKPKQNGSLDDNRTTTLEPHPIPLSLPSRSLSRSPPPHPFDGLKGWKEGHDTVYLGRH